MDKKWEVRLMGSGEVTYVEAPTRQAAVKKFCKERGIYPSIYIKCHYAREVIA
jgi:hypothetical protein